MQLYDQFKSAGHQEEQSKLINEILQIAQEQFYTIGISRPGTPYGLRRTNFKNVPDRYFAGSNFPNPGPTNPEQYFIAQG